MIQDDPHANTLDYAGPMAPPERPGSGGFEVRFAITLLASATLMVLAPWILAWTAIARGGNVDGDFWDKGFIWACWLLGGLIIVITLFNAPRQRR